MPIRVLFLCTGNSARSQMAEGLLRELGGTDFEVHSAGTEPRAEVHPEAVRTMARQGIDIGHQRPKDLAIFDGQRWDYVITLCDWAQETCLGFPEAECLHWGFPDPAEVTESPEQRERAFREVLNGLDRRLRLLIVVAQKARRGVG